MTRSNVSEEEETMLNGGEEKEEEEKPASSRRKVGRKRLTAVLVILVALVVLIVVLCLTIIKAESVLVVLGEKPITPENDERDYRAIVLTNTIRVTLVSDRESRMASSSVNVAVGSLCDPDNVQGLAHFLEHMLFMGTAKYPIENYADRYATENDGWINAWTDHMNTNYYFLVANSGLKTMSDIYAQFFISPLLAETSMYREMNAVQSEYMMGFSSDFWPQFEIISGNADPSSPYSRFSTGSISTLNKSDIQERLWEFYDKYYSANLITVAIIGNETLDTLQSWAEEIFTTIPNKDKTKPVFNELPFPPGNKKYISRAIYYQPKSDRDFIKLIFPINIPNYPNLSYLTYLLGYEGKGSLYQYLATRGYITTLFSSIAVEAHNFILVSLSCDLTEQGLNEPKKIVEALFKFLKRVREDGVNEQLWRENKQIDELRFRFKEKEDPAQYASQISAHMSRVTDPRDYLDPPSRRMYNETLEVEIMEHMTPDNFNLYISTLKLSTQERNQWGPQLTQVEKWYNTPYENLQLEPADILNWKNAPLHEELQLPQTNPFLPDDFIILPYEGRALPVTVNTTEVADMTVWWYQDSQFNQPKVSLTCRVMPKPVVTSVRNVILSQMLSRLFLMETSESLYPAISVDYELAVHFDDFWQISLAGFSDETKVKKVIDTGLDSLFGLDFTLEEDYFGATIREPVRKVFLNIKNLMPAEQARRYARMIQDAQMFDFEVALTQLDSVSQNDIRDYRDTFLSDIAVDCSMMGNVLSAQAADYAEIVKNKLVTGSATVTKEDRLSDFLFPVFKLPAGKTLVVREKAMNEEDPNSAVITQFQIGPSTSNGEKYKTRLSYTRFVLVKLLGLVLKEPCFNYLRTQQQLGYVANCYEEYYRDILVFNIVVQGSRADAGAAVIAAEHDKFLGLQYEDLQKLGTTEEGRQFWEDIKVALEKQITEKPISLREKNGRFNEEIFSTTRDFNRNEKKVAALQEITVADFLDFFQTYLISDSKRKISVQVYGKEDSLPSAIDSEKEILIPDVITYRQTLDSRFEEDE